MTPTVLVVTMGTDYVAPARMPRELRHAGFRVALLAPRSAVATHTRHVDSLGFLPERGSAYAWLQALAAAVRATAPAFVLPGDDVTLRLLMRVALDPPPELRPEIVAELGPLIRRSLGDPARYLDSVDKVRLARLAAAGGIAVPPGGGAETIEEALDVAATVGYPVVVRPAYGTAGEGVAVCASAGALREAMRALPQAPTPLPRPGKRALVQRRIEGRQCNRAAFAWQGREVAGFTRSALVRTGPLAPGSVSRYQRLPAVAEANARLLATLGLTGFASTLFIVDAEDGTPRLIEINRRMTPATHTGRLVGVDLAAAFAACANDRPYAGPADFAEDQARDLALFPQEWLRDPHGSALNTLPNDVPWDDPGLVRAFLDLARG